MIFPPHSSQNPQNQESRTKSPAILFPFQKITNTRYFFLKISSQKSTSKSVDSHRSLFFNQIEGKRKKKNSKTADTISKMHYFQTPFSPLLADPASNRKSRVGREQRFPVGLSYSVGITNRISRARGNTVASVIEHTGHLTEAVRRGGRWDAPFNARSLCPEFMCRPVQFNSD